MMLRKLRTQLTLFYFLAALAIILLGGGGSYSLLHYYLYNATDQAMQVKMALLMNQYGLSLPDELADAEQDWLENKGQSLPTPTPVPVIAHESEDEEREEGEESDEDDEGDDEYSQPSAYSEEHSEEGPYDEELAPVFVLPLNANSELITATNLPVAPITQDKAAAAAALLTGSDLRTIRLEDGSRARLLTYRVMVPGGPELLQVGRLLRDQDRVLSQYLVGLLILAGISSLALGLGSWWLSGRSLSPAQQAWNHQQAFVSNASHELRTPLTLIRATADYALRQKNQADQADHLQTILQECDYMNNLVDDLLLLSRLDSSRLQLTREVVKLPALLSEIEGQFSMLAAAKQVTLKVMDTTGAIWADPIRLRQVLLILLDNALRFTPSQGSIQLATRQHDKECQILVSDQGIGISPEHLPHIFERFYQINNPGVDDSHNNGLGLSIAKELVEAQGGKISLQSQVGKGTLVILTFMNA
ncbi:MAG: HAMP domain-containing histidine kinase [Chloroflexi bacterium]|nr:HAMP domain-containing histidine kinase [Chloroflexota bacterium]